MVYRGEFRLRDCDDLGGSARCRDWQIVFSEAFEVKFDGFPNELLSFFLGFSRRYNTR
jgi:hypothetical protein